MAIRAVGNKIIAQIVNIEKSESIAIPETARSLHSTDRIISAGNIDDKYLEGKLVAFRTGRGIVLIGYKDNSFVALKNNDIVAIIDES